MSARVVALLEPVVGPDRVRVNVALKLNPQTQRRDRRALGPEHRRPQPADDAADQANGAGALGQRRRRARQPAAAAVRIRRRRPPPAVAGAGSSRTAETTNYEVSKTTRHVMQPPGEVARLSVAVILDDDQRRRQDEDGAVTHVRGRARARSCRRFRPGRRRGRPRDRARRPAHGRERRRSTSRRSRRTTPPACFVQLRAADLRRAAASSARCCSLAWSAFFFVVRPLMRAGGVSATAPRSPWPATRCRSPVQRPRTVADLENEIEAQLDAQSPRRRRRSLQAAGADQARERDQRRRNPSNVAKLLRSWIDGRGALTWRVHRRLCPALRKAAIVTLLLGEDASAEVFKHLQRGRDRAARSRRWRRSAACRAKIGEQVLEEFHQTTVAAEFVTARRPRLRAAPARSSTLGADSRARGSWTACMRSFQSTAGFASLEKADPQQLSKFILGEHPQTIALILAHLQPDQRRAAGHAAARRPARRRADAHGEPRRHLAGRHRRASRRVIEQRLKTLGGPSARAARRRARRGRAVQPPRAHGQRAGARGDRSASGPTWRCRSAT